MACTTSCLALNLLNPEPKIQSMKTKIDLTTWPRRDYYNFFGGYDDPYFGVVVNVDCTVAYNHCKERGISFFLYYTYHSIKALNRIENFRYRISEGEVWLFDRVHASPVIAREDHSFGFALFEYTDDFDSFQALADKRIAEVQKYTGLPIPEGPRRLDVVHYTTLPWFSFTSFKHEKNIRCEESVPKIAFGKFFESDGKKLMPMSINAHHGLVDGYHIGLYLEFFQESLNKDS
jgi:chloramphenicol O-acetyltransferase type A